MCSCDVASGMRIGSAAMAAAMREDGCCGITFCFLQAVSLIKIVR